jgi:hypothetical protein
MSRSGYSDDLDLDTWDLVRWRGAVNSATKGKRGQSFFKELLVAMEAMPEKKLTKDALEENGEYCTLGVLGHSRGIDMSKIDTYDADRVAGVFNIATALAQEVVYMNDEWGYYLREETPEERWERMYKWIKEQIV